MHSLGSLTHGTALVKSFRTRNKFSATSVDQLPHQLLAYLMYGHQLLLPVPDIDRTQYFLVLGANPMASNGSLMTVPDFPARLRELKARGGRMVVRRPAPHRDRQAWPTSTTSSGPAPTRSSCSRCSMCCFAEDLATSPVVRRRPGRRPRGGRSRSPPSGRSGCPASPPTSYAASRANSRRPTAAAVYGRVGVSIQEFGLVAQWAVRCSTCVTGNLDRPGGAMFTRPAVDVVGRGLIGRGHHGVWRSRVRGLPEFGGELPVATLADEILTPGDGQVRALLTVAGNPVLVDARRARGSDGAIAGLDFVASVDIYVNETTRHADVILPPTTALERDHYDLVFHVLAVRNTARFTPAVLPKPDGALHDWEIYREIVLRTAALLGAQAAAEEAAGAAGADAAVADPHDRPAAAHRQSAGSSVTQAASGRPGRPRPAASPACPSGCRRRTSASTPRRALVLDDLARLAGRTRSPPTGCC